MLSIDIIPVKKIVSGFLFIICHSSFVISVAQPVASPDVKCVSVAANGDVVLTWTLPVNTGGFISYHVDTSSFAAGPFFTYTTVPTYSTTTCTHFGAGANAKRMYYLVYTESTGLSAPKDTFSTMFLIVANVGGNALLNWNKISNQPIPTSSGWYKIYREYPSGNWMFRDSTMNLTYTDTTDVCNKSGSIINYRIEIDDSTGCTSVSNIAGATLLTDNTPPILEKIDTVSVDASGLATISWYPSPSADADSVVIYKSSAGCNGTWNPIDTVPVIPSFYTYLSSNASTAFECFRIAFLDSCDNISPQGIEHNTIYLSATFDICATTATLVWNQYINMIPAVTQYQIFRSVNGALPFTLLATNPSGDTDYMDSGLALGNSYCYFIRATNGTKTSSSNKACFSASVSQPPLFNYNRFATVLSDKSIQITAHTDTAGKSARYYNLLRATGTGGSFDSIATLSPPITGTTLAYTDNSVSASANIYSYKWQAMDSCWHVILTSNPGTTILLTATVAANLDINLSWNDYVDWSGNVSHYDIYRAVDGVWELSPFANYSYTGSGGTYTDDVAPYFTSKGIFSYKIVAVEGSGNPFAFKDSSTSNIAKVYEYPKIYVPNCFTPNGDNMNDIFIPVIGFIEPAEYTFRIFDNTGTPVFTSTNPAEGWDGKKKNHPCQEGVYMYLIQCKASNGDDSQISGTVSLIR